MSGAPAHIPGPLTHPWVPSLLSGPAGCLLYTLSTHTLIPQAPHVMSPPDIPARTLHPLQTCPKPWLPSHQLVQTEFCQLIDMHAPCIPSLGKGQALSPPSSLHLAHGLCPAVLLQLLTLSPSLTMLTPVSPVAVSGIHTVPTPWIEIKDAHLLQSLTLRPHCLPQLTPPVRSTRTSGLSTISGTSFYSHT